MNACTRLALLLLLLVGCTGRGDDTRDIDRTAEVAASADGASLFDLTSPWRDQTDHEWHLRDLEGRVSVVTMVYTSCTVTCPLILADLQRVDAGLSAEERADVRFVLVSLDPERDQPGRLAQWARDRGLDSSRWLLLVGDDGAVRELSATIGVRFQKQADGEITHTNGFSVIGRHGEFAAQVRGTGQAPELQHQIRRALASTPMAISPTAAAPTATASALASHQSH